MLAERIEICRRRIARSFYDYSFVGGMISSGMIVDTSVIKAFAISKIKCQPFY